MDEKRIVLAGFGGQGLLFAGKVIAYAGLIENREVSWLPSYGPEMRGGTANCSVTVSDEPIGSPLVMDPNVLIAMNQPSLLKFEETVTSGGIILVDTSLVSRIPERDDVKICALEATNMAVLGAPVRFAALALEEKSSSTSPSKSPEIRRGS